MRDNLDWLKGDYRGAFRVAAQRQGIDPAHGLTDKDAAGRGETSYASVHRKVRERRAKHYADSAEKARSVAARQRAGELRGRGLLYEALEDRAALAQWWANSDIWQQGHPEFSVVEAGAIANIRRDAKVIERRAAGVAADQIREHERLADGRYGWTALRDMVQPKHLEMAI